MWPRVSWGSHQLFFSYELALFTLYPLILFFSLMKYGALCTQVLTTILIPKATRTCNGKDKHTQGRWKQVCRVPNCTSIFQQNSNVNKLSEAIRILKIGRKIDRDKDKM